MIDSLRGIAAICGIVLIGTLTTGCSVVGFRYTYRGQQYTMTKPNSDYHQAAIRDVRTRFGDPESQNDIAKLKGACDLLNRYAAEAPDGGSFTPARDLLDAEAKSTCHIWHAREEAERAHADRQRREDEARRDHLAREHQHDEERRARERERLSNELERNERVLTTCDATEAARSARKRHSEILERAPGATVRKSCTPRFETRSVRSECKDANGFARPCTQTVSTGDVAGYSCPKTMDAELVQLGLYQLDLLDAYPYPEDRAIRVRDEECDAARAHAGQTRTKLDELTRITP